METYNIREARTHLSRLVEKAAKGEAFVIARAGKPLVKVVPLEPPAARENSPYRLPRGRIRVPADFDRMAEAEIERLFQGKA